MSKVAYGVTNCGCLGVIVDIRGVGCEAYVVFENHRKSLVRFTAKGEPYFMSYNRRWKLSELYWG